MFCQKCGNPLPKEGYLCAFCGAMMTKEQIMMQKNLMQEHQNDLKLNREDLTNTKLNFETLKATKTDKLIPIFLILGIIIILIILAILLNVR